MSGDFVTATYLIETPYSLEHAAAVIAGEQSTGTFVSVPRETDEIRSQYGAQIRHIQSLEMVDSPSLPGTALPRQDGSPRFYRGIVQVDFPFHNFGPSIPNLLATIAGNLYELKELSGIRLIDVDLPLGFAEKYPGPQFGVEGTRAITQVYGRPVIGTIIKPSIGLSQDDLRMLIRELASAGVDFIKDDELNANPPYLSLETRVNLVMEELNRFADRTGKTVMYACNITGDIEELKRNHDTVVKAGGNCVMVSINSISLAGVAYLRSFSELPIHGHRNQWGAMTRHPLLGMAFTAYQKLCRLAGVDHLHTNGLHNKFYESDESVVKSVQDCLTPMFGGYTTVPVLSSGQWAGSAIESYNALKTIDVMHLAGGGIMAHPDGVAAGVASMKQGWEAALAGVSLETYACEHSELARAIEKFGRKSQ